MTPAEAAAEMEMAVELLDRGETVCFMALGRSMRPFIRSGDRLSIAPLRGRVRPGDVVALRVHGGFGPVHRVVAVAPVLGALVKGDAEARADGWFLPEQLAGRVVRIERDGRLVFDPRWAAIPRSLFAYWRRALISSHADR